MAKYQEIYERLRAKIINKKYKPNTYLPGEYELMEQYDAKLGTTKMNLYVGQKKQIVIKKKKAKVHWFLIHRLFLFQYLA